MLDFDICDTARLARNTDFDGVFFTAVKTTRIYCRPICPANPPLRKNVNFYVSAAACERAGYRPCLRCRPETTPHSPAWNGTKTTITRAIALIENGVLDTINISDFADKLGIGPRHLNRLFQQYAGTSVSQFAKTMRVQKAKRLIDETDLSMREIAHKSGFSSLRRFNSVFKETYRRPPSSLRRKP